MVLSTPSMVARKMGEPSCQSMSLIFTTLAGPPPLLVSVTLTTVDVPFEAASTVSSNDSALAPMGMQD